MRGRNNNRKGPNPLTRNYESNGPDVKIRGSAQQIADKYMSLARDAQSSGDRVMAENYLQHAEHYNRIIMAAQAQNAIQNMRDHRDETDEANDDEMDVAAGEQRPQQAPRNDGSGPQPVIDGVPAEVAFKQNASGQNGSGRGNGEGGRPDHQADDHQVNGAEHGGVDGEEGAAPRRARRPRRNPRDRNGGDADSAQQGADAAPAPNGEAGGAVAE